MADAVETTGRNGRSGPGLLNCPNCGTRVQPRTQDIGRSVECPDCFTPVPVPVDFEIPRVQSPQPKLPSRKRPAAEGRPTARSAPQPRPRVPKQWQAECAGCRTRFQVPVKKAAYETECLVCSQPVRVPGARDLLKPKGEQPADAADSKGTEDATVFDRMAEIREAPRVRRPRWTFFSGVFTYPWYPESVFRWLMLSVGLCIMGVVGNAALMCLFGGGLLLYGAYSLGFSFFWLSIWTLGYTCSCCLAIIGDTEDGQDRVENWPDPHWVDWFIDLLRVGVVELYVLAVAYGIGALVSFGTRYWFIGDGQSGQEILELLPHLAERADIVAILKSLYTEESNHGSAQVFLISMAVAEFLLFPIALLSALESGTVFWPVSGPILRSMARLWWGWLLFYVLASIPNGILMFTAYCWARFPWETVLVAGPAVAAAFFIYARLLGRLAWRITRVL